MQVYDRMGVTEEEASQQIKTPEYEMAFYQGYLVRVYERDKRGMVGVEYVRVDRDGVLAEEDAVEYV